jgi:hypothetical protein
MIIIAEPCNECTEFAPRAATALESKAWPTGGASPCAVGRMAAAGALVESCNAFLGRPC